MAAKGINAVLDHSSPSNTVVTNAWSCTPLSFTSPWQGVLTEDINIIFL
jgi:hypothetical protein